MEICIEYGGRIHCFVVPVIEWPIHIPKIGPGPVNYPAFLSDAVVIASLQSMAKRVSDPKARGSLESGISSAIAAMQEHAGPEAKIRQAKAE